MPAYGIFVYSTCRTRLQSCIGTLLKPVDGIRHPEKADLVAKMTSMMNSIIFLLVITLYLQERNLIKAQTV